VRAANGILIGLTLSLAAAGFAAVIGFGRDRTFYPTVLIVIATYYVLFAATVASRRTLIIEIVLQAASCWLPSWASEETSG
jgi:hypothetical protein